MRIRADVADLIRAGLPVREIAARAHVSAKTIARARRALQLPPVPTGCAPAPSLRAYMTARTRRTPDGHLIWTGPISERGPRVRYGHREGSARTAWWEITHGRPPHGRPRPACGIPLCLAHLTHAAPMTPPVAPRPARIDPARWQQHGLCLHPDADPTWWDQDTIATANGRRAYNWCLDCPVRRNCLDTTLRDEAGLRPSQRQGIRGATTPDQRARLAKKARRS
ncbi:WhiB family transcriptional regulator [Streptomyces sp. DSM 44917]|uniref:WhiB family transcriptional regulator n=1 Tax=Streptomyces boetiae TaxID=3075541 RepID=A0ABU2L3M4_9ACTN|nr:WhiB family transcriptional regulator [Streptomyces sp. DSM 44917]MDT0306166.1 WhiB family transcriptional regulator [Streptomyces sp. DSM 44917]